MAIKQTSILTLVLLAAVLSVPGKIWAECSVTVNGGATNAVSAYSLSGQGNFNCSDLNMQPASATVSNPTTIQGSNGIDWALTDTEVDAVAVQDANGKRCVYNYGPGATGGMGLEPPTNKAVLEVFVCADGFVIPPPNSPPTVTIQAPSDNDPPYSSGDEIFFSATATDTEDGDLSAAISWSSSLDGPIKPDEGEPTGTLSNLSAGTHTITAQVADSGDLIGSDQVSITVEALVVPLCQVGDTFVLINGTQVDCPDGDEPRLVCSADLSDDADKFELDNTGCCVCNTVAIECDPNLAQADDPVNGLEPCPDLSGKDTNSPLQVPTTIILNNDPYYCYTIGGQRRCFYY
jgi:hypothetical protein